MEPRSNLRFSRTKYNVDNAKIIYSALKEAGIDLCVYLPDSFNREIQSLARNDTEITTVLSTREDEGLAICAGARIGGKRPCMIMEASGLGLSAGVLARPILLQRIGFLILVSHVPGLGEAHHYHSETRWLAGLPQFLGIPQFVLMHIEDARTMIRDAQVAIEGQKAPVVILLPKHISWSDDQ